MMKIIGIWECDKTFWYLGKSMRKKTKNIASDPDAAKQSNDIVFSIN